LPLSVLRKTRRWKSLQANRRMRRHMRYDWALPIRRRPRNLLDVTPRRRRPARWSIRASGAGCFWDQDTESPLVRTIHRKTSAIYGRMSSRTMQNSALEQAWADITPSRNNRDTTIERIQPGSAAGLSLSHINQTPTDLHTCYFTPIQPHPPRAIGHPPARRFRLQAGSIDADAPSGMGFQVRALRTAPGGGLIGTRASPERPRPLAVVTGSNTSRTSSVPHPIP